MAISRQNEARRRDYVLLLSNDFQGHTFREYQIHKRRAPYVFGPTVCHPVLPSRTPYISGLLYAILSCPAEHPIFSEYCLPSCPAQPSTLGIHEYIISGGA